MKRIAFVGLLMAALVGVQPSEASSIILRYTHGTGGSTGAHGRAVDNPTMRPFFGYGPDTDPNWYYGTWTLFENVIITNADVGATFTATAANDPDFAAIAHRLTDGVDDGDVRHGIDPYSDNGTWLGGWGVSRDEPVFFNGAAGVDLQGYTVTAIHLTIDALNLYGVYYPGGSTVVHSGQVTWEIEVAESPDRLLRGPSLAPEIFVPGPLAGLAAFGPLVLIAARRGKRMHS